MKRKLSLQEKEIALIHLGFKKKGETYQKTINRFMRYRLNCTDTHITWMSLEFSTSNFGESVLAKTFQSFDKFVESVKKAQLEY